MAGVVVLTSDELRHRFVRMVLALDPDLDVVRSYCESPDQGLAASLARRTDVTHIERRHLDARQRSEDDFFGPLCRTAEDRSAPVAVPRGAINEPSTVAEIVRIAPASIAAFGCSIIGADLLAAFAGRIVNLHLGLSPYYRGSGTNFWALVNDEPELVGATFMYLDAGIDTGEVIHQIRARVHPGDTPHQIGNRLIQDAALAYRAVLRLLPDLERMEQLTGVDGQVQRRADADAEATRRLYEAFDGGLVARYLADHERRTARYPIVEHPSVLATLAGSTATP